MSTNYFIKQASGEEEGPLSGEELRMRYLVGRLREEDLLKREGTDQWVSARSVFGNPLAVNMPEIRPFEEIAGDYPSLLSQETSIEEPAKPLPQKKKSLPPVKKRAEPGEPPPIAGHDDKHFILVLPNGQQVGPLSVERINQLVSQQVALLSSLVMDQRSETWGKVSDIIKRQDVSAFKTDDKGIYTVYTIDGTTIQHATSQMIAKLVDEGKIMLTSIVKNEKTTLWNRVNDIIGKFNLD